MTADARSPHRALRRRAIGTLLWCLLFAGLARAASPREQFLEAKAQFDRGRFAQAATEFKAFLDASPGSADAEAATWMLAESYRETSQWPLAEVEYQHLMSTYPGSGYVSDCSFLLGYVMWRQSSSAPYDQDMTARSMEQFLRFLQLYPDHARAEQARELIAQARVRLAEKLYAIARLYFRMKLHTSSRMYIEQLVQQYPETVWADRGLLLRAQSLEKEGKLGECMEAYSLASRAAHDSLVLREVTKGMARVQKRLGGSSSARTP